MGVSRIVFGLVICSLLLHGCFEPPPPDNLYSYKNITVPADSIPDNCRLKEDCEMFSCLVSQCWCRQIPPEGGVIYRANRTVGDENIAKSVVADYLISNGTVMNVKKAVKLNEIFYNVFYEVPDGGEKVLTVAVDGTVMETICGV